ncbi:MAG TPA: cytochrome P450 [Acidimicrobiia bacterium]|nr:cytochrome P450 [Acidimicrobiia bacterium]
MDTDQAGELVESSALDLLDGDLYAGDPEPVYSYLRAKRPVYWDATNELFGISRYRDIVEIEKDAATWVNSGGYRPNIDADASIIGLDDPVHTERRRLVSRRFTPRAVTSHTDLVRAQVDSLIGAVASKGSAEVIADLAAPLPARMIGHLLGFSPDATDDLVRWSSTTIALGGGPRYLTDEGILAAAEFGGAALGVAAERRGCPVDDLMSVWTQAEVGGCPLSDDDLASDALLLLDGGAETTRTVIANGIDAFIANPDQRDLLRREPERMTVAVEELIRWTTPVLNMCRVASKDTALGDVEVKQGQQVVLMYSSANRDEDIFEDPQRFDVTRHPNPHIAFGFGTHFCLGTSLARLELRIMFEQLVTRLDDWAYADDIGPRRLPNAFVRGITEFPITFTAIA